MKLKDSQKPCRLLRRRLFENLLERRCPSYLDSWGLGTLGEVFREDYRHYREDFHEPIELGPRSPTLYTFIDNMHIQGWD